jgi:C4-dicarboxylate-specific signal transduction histidine kinase
LEKVASIGLRSRDASAEGGGDEVQDLALRPVLDDLRIVIESDWREIDGEVQWQIPEETPRILAERHGLLQVFLNLAQNSHRAVQESPARRLAISVEADESRVMVRFRDSGPGVASPDCLFEPFQPGAEGSGLGLFVSRAVVRGYGGELRYEPQPAGSCFAVELQIVPPEDISAETPQNEELSSTW